MIFQAFERQGRPSELAIYLSPQQHDNYNKVLVEQSLAPSLQELGSEYQLPYCRHFFAAFMRARSGRVLAELASGRHYDSSRIEGGLTRTIKQRVTPIFDPDTCLVDYTFHELPVREPGTQILADPQTSLSEVDRIFLTARLICSFSFPQTPPIG